MGGGESGSYPKAALLIHSLHRPLASALGLVTETSSDPSDRRNSTPTFHLLRTPLKKLEVLEGIGSSRFSGTSLIPVQ